MEWHHSRRVSPGTTRVREGHHIAKGGGKYCTEGRKMMRYVPEQSLGWGGEGNQEKNMGGFQGRPIQRKFGAEE